MLSYGLVTEVSGGFVVSPRRTNDSGAGKDFPHSLGHVLSPAWCIMGNDPSPRNEIHQTSGWPLALPAAESPPSPHQPGGGELTPSSKGAGGWRVNNMTAPVIEKFVSCGTH